MAAGGLSRRVVGVLFGVSLVAGFASFGAVTALNDVARHFGHVTSTNTLESVVGLSGSMLGLGLGAVRLASLVSLPLASLADRLGRTRVLRQTLVLGLVATAAASLSPGYWFFVACFAVARPLLTVSSALVQVVTVELSTTARRMRGLAIMAAGSGIGSGLSAILHGVIRGPDSFRWLFALALVPVLVVVPLMRRVPEPSFRSADAIMARLGAVPRAFWGRLAIVAVVTFAIGMITGPANSFIFVYSEGVLKMSPRVVALIVGLSGLTGLVGLIVSARLARTLGRRGTVALGVLATAATSLLAYGGGRPAFVVGYMVGIFSGGLLSPALTALSTEIFPHTIRATAAGWIVVAGVVGAVAGLALFGFVADSVHAATSVSLRVAALVTFAPFLPTLVLLRRLPESRAMELS